MKEEIDYDCLASIVLEIGDRIKLISSTLIPKDKEPLIKHLAATSIHLALFMQDVYIDREGKEKINENSLKKFLEKCGCNYREKNNGT